MTTRLLRTLTVFFTLSIVWSTAQAQSLPAGWTASDIGAVGAAGTTSSDAAGSFTVEGGGADVWGTTDALRFVHTPLTGDGTIVARVTTVEAVHAWTKVGVMMRESLSAASPQAFMLVSPGKGRAFQRRVSAGGLSTHTGVTGTAPAWVKLERSGNVFTASVSGDGASWSVVGTDTIPMGATIYIGLGVSSHIAGVLATGGLQDVAVTGNSPAVPPPPPPPPPPGALPTGWSAGDIGAVGAEGSEISVGAGNFVVEGAGADVWGTADALRFVYTQLTGDGSIVTQVATLEAVHAWTKGGVMMRETLAANARHAFMLASPGKGIAFQRRAGAGGESTHTAGGTGTAPVWLKLTRAGNTFTAARSADGVTWTTVGSDSIAMVPTIYVGVAVSSHVAGTLATGSFSSTAVTVAPPAPAPPPPPPPPAGGTSTLRFLQWNVHHGGIGTDGVYNPGRVADWIATMNPDVASLNEVDTQDQVNAIVNAVEARTGVNWHVAFSGLGNLVISRLALTTSSHCTYATSGAKAPHAGVMVNGRQINVWSTHNSVSSAVDRLYQTIALQACALLWPEARIIAGDYNMQEGTAEYLQALAGYSDAWPTAKSRGTATNYSGNCDGCTRNSRIDYVFSSGGALFLSLESAQIVDTRNASGHMPSDHKPMLVVYRVN